MLRPDNLQSDGSTSIYLAEDWNTTTPVYTDRSNLM
jgi:hypothetical protein